MFRIIGIINAIFLLLLLCSCGFTVPMLPIPLVEQKPIIEYQGEIVDIEEPLNITHSCCPKFKVSMEVYQTEDSGKFSSFRIVDGYGEIGKKQYEDWLSANLTFTNYETDVFHFNEKDSLECKLAFRKTSLKCAECSIRVKDIFLSELSKKASFLEKKGFIKGMKRDMEAWLLWMFHLPNKPVKSGSIIDLTPFCPSRSCCRMYNGREVIPCAKFVQNNSHVLGFTNYNNRDHVAFVIDFSAEQPGKSDVFIRNPLALYTKGYILVDKETGLHSLGSLKTRLCIQHHFSTRRYWIDYKFKMEPLNDRKILTN